MKGLEHSVLVRLIALAMLPLAVPAASASAPSHAEEPATPVLLERAVARGELGRLAADRYLVSALRGEQVPEAFASDTPIHATLELIELRARLAGLPAGAERRSLRALLHPTPIGTDRCDLSTAPLPNTVESAHFYLEYSAATIGGGLTIDDYIAALETSWAKEVDEFGWAAPPSFTPSPAPNNKYPVRIDNLGPAIYGFVSNVGTHAGLVGDNPATGWNEGDASASCMALNTNFDPFPGSPLVALQATAAHEFNHSIQFGWGALSGTNVPDQVFIEGGATWMEDEVFDEANDNYNYLWPVFEDDMGDYQGSPTRSPYDYWITWRGITERYGTGVAGGGEDVMQRFWELTSKDQAEGLEALDRALEAGDSSLSSAYHAYAVAVRFAKPCGGGYVAPYCLEEGPGYVAVRGQPPGHGTAVVGAPFSGSLPDNYSLNWITLSAGSRVQVVLRNTGGGGRLRASVGCDTGTGITVLAFSDVAGPGESVYQRSVDPGTCPNPIAVVTNVSQTAANPPTSLLRDFTLSLTLPARATRLTVSGRVVGGRVIATGKLLPRGSGSKITVTLFRRAGGWKEIKSRGAKVGGGGKYRTSFPQPDGSRCRLVAEFEGTVDHLPSTAKRAFSC